MKLNTIKKVVETAIKLKIKTKEAPLNLVGHAGIGKTQTLEDVAAELKLPIYMFRLGSMQDVGDLMGMPYITEDKKTEYGVPNWYKTIKDGGILFIDEINRCKPSLMDAVMQLLDKGRFNGFVLPDNVFLVSAMNPDDEKYEVTNFDAAVVDRCVSISVNQYPENVLSYMIEHNYNNKLIDFASMTNEDFELGGNVELPKKEFTPRSLRQLNIWMPVIEEVPEAEDELVMGCVGIKGYSKWKNISMLKEIPSAEDVFKNWNTNKPNIKDFSGTEKIILMNRIIQYLKNCKKITNEIKTIFTEILVELGEPIIAYTFRLSFYNIKYLKNCIDYENQTLQKICNKIEKILNE